jgi:hypothetical protein
VELPYYEGRRMSPPQVKEPELTRLDFSRTTFEDRVNEFVLSYSNK